MRSHALFRRSRSLFRTSKFASPICLSSRPLLINKREPSRTQTTGKRSLSSNPLQSGEPPASSDSPSSTDPPESGPSEAPPPTEEPEPPKQRTTRASSSKEPTVEPPKLPDNLDILWVPEADTPEPGPSKSSALPPPEVFEEALNNLHITLHPQTQHRAAYPTSVGQPIEPTLALYCPIEGGDYIIDATVGELARSTGAEVLVLDSVQLAAGEWGDFGKAANSLQLPRNPLHFPSSPADANTSSTEDPDEDDEPQMSSPQMTLTLMSPSVTRGAGLLGSAMVSSKRPSTPISKVKVFFDSLVNLSAKNDQSTLRHVRPRIVYIRDFPTLAPTSSTWYPHLLAAVRQRRRGALSRPSSPVTNPMTIVFGITPPLTPSPGWPTDAGASLVSLLMNRMPSSQLVSPPKSGKTDWSEGEAADKARERRLRDRLKKWEKGDAALLDEIPKLSASDEQDSGSGRRPDVIILGPNNISGIAPGGFPSGSRSSEPDANSMFFRTSILVPGIRSTVLERECRVARRREINELTMRMAVGAVGGVLEEPLPATIPRPFASADENSTQKGESAVQVEETEPPEEPVKEQQEQAQAEELTDAPSEPSAFEVMWDDWGRRIEVWPTVRHIADHAVGSVVAGRTLANGPHGKPSLEHTVVPWSAVQQRWVAHRSARDLRKTWMKDALPASKSRNDQREDHEEDEEVPGNTDEVIERLKNDGDLDAHEQRILPCIVDTTSMPTSFSQVHLPPHTIDSVRTIVSLPLIHPQAFQKGILKEHGMTGCLLFGPPGTGKTLVVRALAKEAGCRMMVVTPADVMDMYVGEGEKLVKAVFSLARKLSPCVVFLDEIDALFGARMSSRESGGAVAHRGVITEFMQEMDGLKTSRDANVIVIGATNRPFDLDDAVLRRLPRRLLVDLPGQKEREEILKIHLRDEILGPNVDIASLARRTESFSGSDLKYLCVSAALHAVKEHVKLPWATPLKEAETSAEIEPPPDEPPIHTGDNLESAEKLTEGVVRVLNSSHFAQALKEITPSSSEALGTLSDLRKWNEEFGEGHKDKKRRLVWGKGRFGFNDKNGEAIEEEGRVLPAPPSQRSLPAPEP